MTPKKQPDWKVIGAASLAAFGALFVILILEIIILKPFGGGKKGKTEEASVAVEAAEDAVRNVFPSGSSGTPSSSTPFTPSAPSSPAPSAPEIGAHTPSAYEMQVRSAIAVSGDAAAVLCADGSIKVAGGIEGSEKAQGLVNAVAIDGGHFHIAGLRPDGTVVAFGNTRQGQCNVDGWTDIKYLDCGYSSTAGVRSDGTVVICGMYGFDIEECVSPGWTDIVAVSVGYEHMVGLKSDGTVVAAGTGNSGDFTDVSGWSGIVEVAAGRQFTAGLCADGTVVISERSNSMSQALEWTDIVHIKAGDLYLWGLHADGTLEACGYNDDGECDVYGWTDVVDIYTSFYYGIGIRSDGTVLYAGEKDNKYSAVCDWTGVAVPGEAYARYDAGASEAKKAALSAHSPVQFIIAGGRHVVGLCYDGTVVAAGANDEGQCNVEGWTDIIDLAAGRNFTVGLRADGTVVATGGNSDGQCNVEGWTNIKYIACGSEHTIGLREDGTLVATGDNYHGQCNIGDWSDIRLIGCGQYHTLGLRGDGTVIAVGDDSKGQCSGVAGWTGVRSLHGGGYLSFAISSDGFIYSTDLKDIADEWTAEGYGETIRCWNGGINRIVITTDYGIVRVLHEYVPSEVEEWTGIRDCGAVDSCYVAVTQDNKIIVLGYDHAGLVKAGQWSLFDGYTG